MNKAIWCAAIAMIIGLMAFGCLPFIPIEPTPTPTPSPEPAPIPAPSNLPPVAYIDSVAPSESARGEPVYFKGHGTDEDGSVVAYRWSSSRDSDLSSTATFESASLSEGDHTISLTVQDNNGDWSEEVTTTLRIVAPVEPSPDPASQPLMAKWSGQWDTGVWGVLTLIQSGNQVTGTYTYEGGTLTATATGDNGDTLVGIWSEDPTHMPPDDAGDMQFTMSADGASFTGQWRYDSSGAWQPWEGQRVE